MHIHAPHYSQESDEAAENVAFAKRVIQEYEDDIFKKNGNRKPGVRARLRALFYSNNVIIARAHRGIRRTSSFGR